MIGSRLKIRNLALISGFASIILWAVGGLQSSTRQVLNALLHLPRLLTRKIGFREWVALYKKPYGADIHWSTIVIYSLTFYGLNRYYEKRLGINRKENLLYAFSWTWVSIIAFETFWVLAHSFFHGSSLTFPTVLRFGLYFSVVFLIASYVYNNNLQLRFDETATMLAGCTVVAALFWIYWPLSTHMFPQNCYGVWGLNDVVYAVNVLVKALFTLTVYYVARVEKLGVKQYFCENCNFRFEANEPNAIIPLHTTPVSVVSCPKCGSIARKRYKKIGKV